MEKLEIQINKISEKKVEIIFSRSTMVKSIIQTTDKQLMKYYKVTIEDLSPGLLRKIVSESKLKVFTEHCFDSKVTSFLNKNKSLFIQIENSLIHITNKNTGEELFTNKTQVSKKNLYTLTEHDFIKIKEDKQKMVALNTYIKTSDRDFEFNSN